MNIFPDYIDAAREMYSKFGVDADIRAVGKIEYQDPIAVRTFVLPLFWKIVVKPPGATEVWNVVLPKPNFDQHDEYCFAEFSELRGIEFDSHSTTKWNIDFQAESGIIVSAKTRDDLVEAMVNCRECIEQMKSAISCAA